MAQEKNKEIAVLREEIAGLDRALRELLERRFDLAAKVGRLKAELAQPVKVREVEQRVLLRAREAAELCGVSPEVMEAIFSGIIRGSVERQHRIGMELRASGKAKVLILGSAGAMGGWLRRFLESLGHSTEGVDTAWAGLPEADGRYARIEEVPDLNSYDALFVSVPLEATKQVLQDLASSSLTTPLFEIASIKSHLEEPLRALRQGGTPTLSLHPMFGPGKNPYETLTMVHAVVGDQAKERAVIQELLDHPYLDLVSLPFQRHDRLMGWVLGLAHMTGMLFADALSHSDLDPLELERIASTTFSRQVDTARSVLEEDPDLYFAIQRLNPFRGEMYQALARALDELTGTVDRDERETFAHVLTKAATMLPDP